MMIETVRIPSLMNRTAARFAALALALTLPLLSACHDAHVEEIEEWRASRDASLRRDEGWLSLVGLFSLGPGIHRIGSDPALEITLDAPSVPPFAGTLELAAGGVTLRVAEGAEMTIDSKRVETRVLNSDASGQLDVVSIGRLKFYVIERGEKVMLRVKDPESRVLQEFSGMEYFDIDRSFRIVGSLEPYDPPKKLTIPTVLGISNETETSGYLRFEIDGEEFRLDPQIDPESGDMFVIFKDDTSGNETYGAGRFLGVAAADESGRAVIDFNLAYNPPCVFTPYATCPLPPKQNALPLRIEAGELTYGSH